MGIKIRDEVNRTETKKISPTISDNNRAQESFPTTFGPSDES